MKKVMFSVAFLSLVCASPMFAVDVMPTEPVIQTAPATVDPKVDPKVDPTLKDEGVKTIDNLHDATDFVAPVDAE